MPIAVVPAAGSSRRMGRPKLLLPWGSTTILGALVDALERGGVEEVVVVVAAGDERLADWSAQRDLRVVVNPRPERGMLSSIREAVSALGGGLELAERGTILLVCPGDMPRLRSSSVAALLGHLGSGAGLAVPVYRGRRGHPLAISAALIPQIDELDGSVGLRELLDRHREALVEVEVDDPGTLFDVDTPQQYRGSMDEEDRDTIPPRR